MRTSNGLFILCSLSLVACGYEFGKPIAPKAPMATVPIEEPPVSEPEPVPVPEDPLLVTMQIDTLTDAFGASLLDGCDTWNETGVTCTKSVGETKIDFDVILTDDECVNEVKHTMVLAYANFGGRQVVLYRKCLAASAHQRKIDEATLLVTVAAHEIGHMLGILGHIAPNCDVSIGDQVSSGDGVPLCGKALMNPSIDKVLVGLTEQDLLAFAGRNTARSVIGSQKSASHHAHDCTMEEAF